VLTALCISGIAQGQDFPIFIDISPYRTMAEVERAELLLTGLRPNDARLRAHTAILAARELRHYLLRITGAEASAYPIRTAPDVEPERGIVLATGGAEQSEALKESGSFALIPEGGRLTIRAATPEGVLYGAYEFLEQQGVRWYAPGEMGEVAPRRDRIVFPSRAQIHRPALKTRGFWAWEGRGGDEFLWWMARNRLNYWAAAEANQFLAARLGILGSAGSHWIWPDYLDPDAEYPYRLAAGHGSEHKPPDPYPGTAGAGDRNGDGRITYFEAHPEWYGLRNGKRTPFQGISGVNVCSSNPHVVTELCKRLVNDLAGGRFRDVSVLDFWALDGGRWCECEECARLGAPTDRLLRLVHQVNQALEEAENQRRLDRRVRVFFPIYLDTLPPPTLPLPSGFDYSRAFGNFFPIRRSFLHPLHDPASEINAPIWKTIRAWLDPPAHFQGRFVMGEYYGVSTTKNLPVLYTRTMPADVGAYRDILGVEHMHYMHAPTKLLGPRRLNNYLLAKLWWDPAVKVEELLAGYYRDLYGPWAERMRHFYERLETALAPIHEWKANPEGLARRLARRQEPFFVLPWHPETPVAGQPSSWQGSLAAVRDCRRILNEVRRDIRGRTEESGLIDARVREDERNLRYAENTLLLWDGIARTLRLLAAGDREGARRAFRATFGPARALKVEVALLQSGSGHSNAPDGLNASQVETVWNELAAELGEPARRQP
jgi:hypothetical protein